MPELSDELAKEQQALEREIRQAFAEVTREGGVSWGEAHVIDDYGTTKQRLAVRSADDDESWKELAEDPEWNIAPAFGGFSFLDPIGFRYYLPAAMIRTMEAGAAAGSSSGLDFHLWLQPGKKESADKARRDRLAQWTLLDERQRQTVARFLRFMIQRSESLEEWIDMKDWQKAYDSHWNQFGER